MLLLVLFISSLCLQLGTVEGLAKPEPDHHPHIITVCPPSPQSITITRTIEKPYVETVTVEEASYHHDYMPVTEYVLETVDVYLTHQVTVTPTADLTTVLNRHITTPYYTTTTATFYNTVFHHETCSVLVTDVYAQDSLVQGKDTTYFTSTYTRTSTTYSLSTMYQTSEWHRTIYSVVTYSTNVPHFVTSTNLITALTTLISTDVNNFSLLVTATLAATETVHVACAPSPVIIQQTTTIVSTHKTKGETGKTTGQKIKEFFRDKITNKFLRLFGKGIEKYEHLESKGLVHPLTDALASEQGQALLSGGQGSSSGKGKGKGKGGKLLFLKGENQGLGSVKGQGSISVQGASSGKGVGLSFVKGETKGILGGPKEDLSLAIAGGGDGGGGAAFSIENPFDQDNDDYSYSVGFDYSVDGDSNDDSYIVSV
ncbi:hypothetical protein Pmani_018919 [Petrolisthes manimaculis]|uniref:Uncharacterized protein n=1 Tax=Petrolisthes manimaculis TaxID=1843537 RepID=A0AAE1U4F6_9EUCA|nr:hypothetical protein Pmani_018919 [Petrolisthes manimaculis]